MSEVAPPLPPRPLSTPFPLRQAWEKVPDATGMALALCLQLARSPQCLAALSAAGASAALQSLACDRGPLSASSSAWPPWVSTSAEMLVKAVKTNKGGAGRVLPPGALRQASRARLYTDVSLVTISE